MNESDEARYLSLQKKMRTFYEALDAEQREKFLKNGRREFANTFEQVKELVEKTYLGDAEKEKLMEYCLGRYDQFRTILDEDCHD